MSDDARPDWLDFWNPGDELVGGGMPAHLDPRYPPFNPGWRPADHEVGVALYAPWEEVYAGFPEHGRRLAIALRNTRLPVHLRSAAGGMQFQTTTDVQMARAFENMKTWLSPLLNASIKTYGADIWHVVAEDETFHRLAGPLHHWMNADELAAVQRCRIISTVFERDRISDSVAQSLKRVAQIWVANNRDRAMLMRSGVPHQNVHVVPIPYFPNDPHLELAGRQRVPGVPRFVHIGKWEPRKAQHEIFGAFLTTFEPGEAQLLMKTSLSGPKLRSGYPESPQLSLELWLSDDRVKAKGWTLELLQRYLFLVQARLPASRLVQLHRTADVYVTLSRGEGFDMPAFDSKLAENLMVYTPSGGPQTFACVDDECVEPSGTVACDPFYGWGDARYLDYTLEAAGAALRAAHAKILAGVRVRNADDFAYRFSAKQVGLRMRQLVNEILR